MSTQQAHVNVTAIVRKTLSDQPVLCVRSTQTEHTETDWCAVGEAIGEAWQVLERQALISAGPPYTRFHPGGWEAGVPVDRAGIS